MRGDHCEDKGNDDWLSLISLSAPYNGDKTGPWMKVFLLAVGFD